MVYTRGNLQQKYASLSTTTVYCADAIPCKNYDPLTCVYIVLKSGPLTVCSKFARCHPNFIVFNRHISEEFCNENLTSLSPPNLALHAAAVPCKASNNLSITKCMLAKLNRKISPKREVRGSEQMFKVLSISSHTGAQPSMPLVDGLVDNTLLQTRPCGNQALHRLLLSSIYADTGLLIRFLFLTS